MPRSTTYTPSRRRALAALAAGGVVAALPAWATAGRSNSSDIDSVIDSALAEQRLVGAVVLVRHKGRVIHQRAAGWADREARTPMRADALFRLASVSKPVVTAAAMALVARGTLELDAPVTRWLPGFRPALADGSRPDITLRQLLTHTSGLGYGFTETGDDRPYAQLGVSDGLDRAGISLQENMQRLARAPLLAAPGTRWAYSLGIDVVGAIIERAWDGTLPDAVQTLVGAPLGWSDTAFLARDAARLTAVYVNGEGVAPSRMETARHVPLVPGNPGVAFDPSRATDPAAFPSGGAGMVGCAGDILALLEALRERGGGVVPAAIAAEMARDQVAPLDSGQGTGFGLGFSVLREQIAAGSPESPGTWRWGGVYGHSWFVDPARALTVVALTNTLYEGMSGRFVNALRDAVYRTIG